MPLLAAQDDQYVGGFTPGPYQGVTQSHDLVLDFGPLPRSKEIRLFLQGWLFPTDASINAAGGYPAVIGAMAIVVTIFLLTFVLPKFYSVFEGKEEILPWATKFLMNTSRMLIASQTGQAQELTTRF